MSKISNKDPKGIKHKACPSFIPVLYFVNNQTISTEPGGLVYPC